MIVDEVQGVRTLRPLVPVQVDGHSCGVMTLMNMHYAINDMSPKYPYATQGMNYTNMRKRIAKVILQKLISVSEFRASRPERVTKGPAK